MLRILSMLVGVCLSLQAQAFTCYLTMIKDSCWTNYNLNVTVSNPATEKKITSIVVPPGKSWTRQKFDCQPKEALALVASFTPVFWENDAGKTYTALREWFLPEEIKKGDTAWNVTVCYPKEFAEVPFPPDAVGNCKCNTDDIPAIPPQ